MLLFVCQYPCVLYSVVIFQDDEYRGKGTTGLPYFECGHNNAVWVSMDMVVYPPPTTVGRRVPHGNTSNGKKSTGTKQSFGPGQSTEKHGGQHKPLDNGKNSTGQNTTVGSNKSSRQGGIVSNVGNMASNVASNVASKAWNLITGPTEVVEKDQQQNSTNKRYKEGDRVVIYSMKTQQPISAIVRWTGQVKFSKLSDQPSAMVAGLETVSCMFEFLCFCVWVP